MGNNFKLYNASAGSGKTFTLIKEYLFLSLSSDFPSYKNILAVTFTNKAANEMKAKILNYLHGIVNDSLKGDVVKMKEFLIDALHIDEPRLKKRASLMYENILHNYSDFSVSTIDAFVQKISRNFAKELNLPNQYKVQLDEDEMLDELIQRIDKKIGDEDKLLTQILSQYILYQINEENSWHIESPIKKFIAKLLKESAYKKGGSIEISLLNDVQYKEVEKYLQDKISELKKIIDGDIDAIDVFNNENGLDFDIYNKVLPSMLNKIRKDIDIKPDSLVNKTIKEILNDDKNWYKGKKQPDVSEDQKNQLLGYFVDIIEHHKSLFIVNIIQKNLYLYVLRGSLHEVINQYIEDTNKVHISEFNKRLSDVIDGCSVPFIYERIGEKYRHYFIDEFQDTSLLQWFNFLPLINNSLATNNMNLLVGDAKQAIYRFRSGEVEQIINLPNIYKRPDSQIGKESENKFNQEIFFNYLETNYRSQKNIVGFNNSFFRKSRAALDKYRSVYENKMEQRYSGNSSYDGFVSVEIFDIEKLTEYKSDRSDGVKSKTAKSIYRDAVKKSILRDINNLIDNGFQYKDIAILVRNNSEGSEIAEFLTANDIRVISSDSILLKSSDEVQLIIQLLRFMMDENNAVLRLSLSYYQELCKKNGGSDKLKTALNYDIDIDEIHKMRNKAYSLYDLCSQIIKMYGFNIVDDVFLQYFMNEVHSWQNNENNGINAFLEYWDRKCDVLSVKSASKENAVEIMTIHKSKGLDFKVVMYPYAVTRVPEKFKGSEIWLSFKDNFDDLKDIPHIEDFILPISSSLVETKMESYYREEYEKTAFDDFNIMYVATTRAKDVLYIYTDNSLPDSNPHNFFLEYFNDKDCHYYAEYDHDNKEIFRDDLVYDDNTKSDEIAENSMSVIFTLGELKYIGKNDEEDISELDGKGVAVKTIDWQNDMKFKSDPTMFWAQENAELMPQEWGNLVHEILSKINTCDDARRIIDAYVNDGSIDEEKAELLMKQFDKIVHTSEIEPAYSKDAIVKNEMEILTKEGKTLRPDRYVELHDKEIVIDYKTGKPNEGYYAQLQNYMIALQDMGINKNIEAYIVYLGEKIDVQRVFLDRLF